MHGFGQHPENGTGKAAPVVPERLRSRGCGGKARRESLELWSSRIWRQPNVNLAIVVRENLWVPPHTGFPVLVNASTEICIGVGDLPLQLGEDMGM